METASAFFGGIVFTIVVAFMYFKWSEMKQRSRDRKAQATRRNGPHQGPRPDYNPDRHEP